MFATSAASRSLETMNHISASETSTPFQFVAKSLLLVDNVLQSQQVISVLTKRPMPPPPPRFRVHPDPFSHLLGDCEEEKFLTSK